MHAVDKGKLKLLGYLDESRHKTVQYEEDDDKRHEQRAE